MKEEHSKHIISQNASLIEALKRINDLSNGERTLIVVDNKFHMIGTLTDGDIRRKIILGYDTHSSVNQFMNTSFKYLLKGDTEFVQKIRYFRDDLNISLLPILHEDGSIFDIINLKQYRSSLPIDAVIMAGGKGERLRPLTLTTPKPLLPVGDKAIIDHNIDRLIYFGIRNISVTVNYLKEQLIEHFTAPYHGIPISTIPENQFLGTIGAVKYVKTFHNDTILVMNSDLYTDIDFEQFYLNHIAEKADMSVGAIPYTVAVPYGIFDLEGDRIKGVLEKPTYNYYANSGIYLINKELLSLIPDDTFYNATDLIATLIEKKRTVVRYPLAGYWIDIGNKEEYQKAQEFEKHFRKIL